MQVIRRLYLYGMSGVMLAILATGLQTLVRAALDAVGIAGEAAFGMDSSREQLSLAGALIGVSLPGWGIHWWLVTRSLRPDATDARDELDSSLRSFYLTAVLAVSLLFLLFSAHDLARPLMRLLVGAGDDVYDRPDTSGSLATLIVAGAAWLLHVWFRRSDMAAGPLGAGSMVWPRVYLYGVQLVGAFVLIGSIRRIIEVLGGALEEQPAYVDPSATGMLVASELTILVVVGVAFVIHAWYTASLLRDPGWRGAGERPSTLRVTYFAILLLAGAAYVLSDLAGAARAVLIELLGAPGGFDSLDPFGVAGRSLAARLAIPLISAIPWLLAGLAARRQLLREAAASDDPGRPASIVRLDLYVVSLVGLVFGAVASGWLLGFGLDAAFGGTRTVGSSWKLELADMLPMAILGSGLWALRWWHVVARREADPAGEANSRIRRFTLLLILGGSILASVGSVALILYRVFGTILGVDFGESVVSALSTPVGALLIAAAVALYHGLLVREDLPVRAASGSPPSPAELDREPGGMISTPAPAGDSERPAPTLPDAEPAIRRSVVVSAGSPEVLEAALESMRRSLPEGAHLEL